MATLIKIRELGINEHRQRIALYLCEYCGNPFSAETRKVEAGSTRSCGCARHYLSKDTRKNKTRAGLNNYSKEVRDSITFKEWIRIKDDSYEEWQDYWTFVDEVWFAPSQWYYLVKLDPDSPHSKNNSIWRRR